MKLKIIVVDDDAVDQQVISRALKKAGVEVQINFASSAAEMFNTYNTEDFDFFFIDYLLPGINGIELIKKMRQLNNTKPIVLITAQDNQGLAESAIAAGASNYMTKELIHAAGLLTIIRTSESMNKYEQKIKDLLFKQESILNASNLGTFEWDIENGLLIVNDKWCEIVGYTREDLNPITLETLIDLIHPDDITMIQKGFRRCFKKEDEYYDVIFRMKHKSGNWIWIRDRGKVTVWANETRAIKMFGTHADITERKEHTLKLSKLSELLEQTNSAARIGTWDINLKKMIVAWSKVTHEIHEVDPNYVADVKNAINFYKEGVSRELMNEAINNVLSRGESFDLELEMITAKGRDLWVRVIGLTEFSDGECKRIYGSLQDIDTQKRLQEELKDAKEIAEQAVFAKDRFLANMSHEIRTPMNAIIGFTELMAQTELREDQKEFTKSIKRAGDNLLAIINDILDFSKIESGKLLIEAVPFYLKETLKHIQNLFKQNAREKKIDYNFLLDAGLPEQVVGDSTRLNQILINLVGNALKFTSHGSVTVSVKNIEEDEHCCKLNFSIADTGIGISKDKLDMIFDRFTQANNDTTRKFGGSGLGLNIAKSLIELQGGAIKLTSEEGKGSEFSFTLMFKKASSAGNVPVKEAGSEIQSISNVEILLCEDNDLNQLLAKNVIRKFGFNLQIANNGKEGIELLKKSSFDLILMDLQMPEMNGYQTTLFIRNELKLDIPIIAMTAHSFVGVKENCLELGMNDYIPKPFNQANLYSKIISQLKNKPVDISPATSAIKDGIKSVESINLNYLKELAHGNTEFMKEMISMFLKKVPLEIELLNVAFGIPDYLTIQKLVHKLKSSIAIVGLDHLLPYFDSIEKETENQVLSEKSRDYFEKIKTALDHCYPLLNNYMLN